ncbi:arsenical resistance operon repressor, putative [Ferroglobus placidus DSM 10642]|uniref:Arsenical resistance operon repressor, putative n=1 Tax=Ferroglobus placidus (strain DSM 10642 / AEDII12DO) TaxID=589924 RepID=D3S1Y0_FERPA|nr:winged helix-turn-helix domain-containing protein [Ferroglobus placidus]ADC64437.1 arsenical resistance operon repressor, putative [Ferroglobus placidus DSM 10642]
MKFEEWISAKSTEEAEEYRKRFKMAISNSIRRRILALLNESEKSLEELKKELKIDEKLLKFHLDTLEKASCITVGDKISLTDEGRVLAEIVKKKTKF